MKKSCQYCGRIHDVKMVCPYKPKRDKRDYNNSSEQRKAIAQFRNSKAWHSKREEIQQRDMRLCQICVRDLYDTIDKFTYEGTSVHHIIPLVDDWSKRLDNDNLIVLCSGHHADAERGNIPAWELMEIVHEQERIFQYVSIV